MAWCALREGRRPRKGIDDVGSDKRIGKLSWCIHEALREADAKFLTRSASCIWLARDARKHRLLVRFRAVGFQNGAVVTRHGVLGQAKQFGSNALDILEATKNIVQRATMVGAGIAVRLGSGPYQHDVPYRVLFVCRS